MDRSPSLGLVLGMFLLALLTAGPVAAGAHAAQASAAAAQDLQCSGVVTAVTVRNVTVPSGGTCILRDSKVSGAVTAASNSYFQAIHTTINGDVAGNGAETLFVEGGSKVRGSLRASRVAQVFLFGSTVRGDVKVSRSSDQVFICGSTVERGSIAVTRSGRDILIGDPRSGGCPGNSVLRGDMTVRQNRTDVELVVSGNVFPRGNLTVSGNTGPSEKVVRGNSGGKRLSCQANGPKFKASKNLRWNSGDCGGAQ